MNTNKKIQELIGSIIGKDYFKLEWGCKVIDDYGEAVLNKSYKKMGGDNDLYEGKNSKGNTVITHIKEIIGFEPTLNDVLLAIGMKRTVYLKTLGEYTRLAIDEEDDKNDDFNLQYIDLTKSIFNQSEETKVALINLLENK